MLSCSECGGVSQRPSGFVAVRHSFMCDHCRSLVRIAAEEPPATGVPSWERPPQRR